MAQVHIKAGHVQPVWAGHPWVFAQGIGKRRGKLEPGSEVQVRDEKGHVLGRGLYSPNSAIAVRLYTRAAEESLGTPLVEARLRAALERRQQCGLPNEETSGFRALYGEGDDLPGLIVDVFGRDLVVQFGTIGMHRRKGTVLDALRRVFDPARIIDRTSEHVARLEGFEHEPGLIAGSGDEPLCMTELGLEYSLPLHLMQKTGFYFDQRPLRKRIAELAPGRSVLDAYSYVGASGFNAARAGASRVLCVDSSEAAHETGREIAKRNDVTVEWQAGDAIEALSAERDWDVVIADPPKLATGKAHKPRAMSNLRRVAKAACLATRPGGFVSLSSCSAAIGMDDVGRALALGARDAGVQVRVIDRIFQGADHPVPPAFPEGLYLSTLIAQVDATT